MGYAFRVDVFEAVQDLVDVSLSQPKQYLDGDLVNGLLGFGSAVEQGFEVIVDIFEDYVLDELICLGARIKEVLSPLGLYQHLNHVLAVFEFEEDLVLAAELVTHLLDSLEGDLPIVALIEGLEHVT